MAGKRDRRKVEMAAEMVADELLDAVAATIESGSPDPARERCEQMVDIDRQAAPDQSGGPVELMAVLAMVRWLSLAREQLADRPQRVDEVLAWIEDGLGTRYRARARYTSGVLQSEEAAGEIMEYRKALREDFLPSLVWLTAATVALHGDGDPEWLRNLERATT